VGFVLLVVANGNIAGAADLTVTMVGMAYEPMQLSARLGDTVIFVNNDTAQHQPFVPTVGYGVNLGDVKPGQKRAMQLLKAGRFEVECAYHPNMLIRITVAR
jgi:plastocyanin